MSKKRDVPQQKQENLRRQLIFSAVYMLGSPAVLLILQLLILSPGAPQPAPYSTFLDALAEAQVTAATIGETRVGDGAVPLS